MLLDEDDNYEASEQLSVKQTPNWFEDPNSGNRLLHLEFLQSPILFGPHPYLPLFPDIFNKELISTFATTSELLGYKITLNIDPD